MKWLLIFPLIFLLTLNFSVGVVCTDFQLVNQTCQMVTPSLSCPAYTYSIINSSQVNIENGSLNVYSGSNYYFNFTELQGQYVIQLCDGSSRVITVGNNGDNSMLGALILIPLIFAAILLYWMNSLSEEHNILKLLIGLLPIPLLWVSMMFASTAIINVLGLTDLVNQISFVVRVSGFIFFLLVAYFILYILITSIDGAIKKRQNTLEY